MRHLLVISTVILALSACSNSQQSSVSVLFGFGGAIENPGYEGVRVNNDGVFANFFRANTRNKAPAVLLLAGSEGGLSPGEAPEIKGLTAAGFNVLYLCYFGCPGTPTHLVAVPLETFDRGLAFLRVQPSVDPARIAILGESKGAEAALLVGARDPKVT